MFPFNQLKQVHIEITSRCQASCPMCSRNYHGGLPNPNLKISDWSFSEFQQVFDNVLLAQLSGLYFCGNFGDPIINDELIDMCQYVTTNAGHIEVRIHTNGSARSKEWWQLLAKSLPKNHVVIFGLDGLEDTHHLYRVGTNFKKIVENAQAFIQAGGTAEWVFIKFKHNEHQTEQARQLATEIGFHRFSVKNSIRFLTGDKFEVLDKDGNVKYNLQPPSKNKITFIDRNLVNRVDSWLEEVEIDCYVQKNKEVYMDAHRNLFPCCFLASTPYNYAHPGSIMEPLKTRALEEYNNLVSDIGVLDLTKKHTKDIIDSNEWQTLWNRYWSQKQLLVCAKTCGKSKKDAFSKPADQIIERVNLNE